MLSLEWDAIDGAQKYEIEVFKVQKNGNKKLKSFFNKKPKWKARLKPGKYKLRLRTFDNRNVPGEWGDYIDLAVKLPNVHKISPKNESQIKPIKNSIVRSVEFKWKPIKGIKKFKLKISSNNHFSKTLDITNINSKKIELPIGFKYNWDVISIGEKNSTAENEKSNNFTFTLLGSTLPKPQFKIDKILKNGSAFFWENHSSTQKTSLKVWYLDLDILKKENPFHEKLVLNIENFEENSFLFQKNLQDGFYRIQIQSHANLWNSSPTESLFFHIQRKVITKASTDLKTVTQF